MESAPALIATAKGIMRLRPQNHNNSEICPAVPVRMPAIMDSVYEVDCGLRELWRRG